MTGSYGIDSRYLDSLRQVFAGFPHIEKVWLYGSRARGDWAPASDIDFAIEGELFSLVDLLDLRARLNDLPLIFKIDLIPMNGLENENLKNSIRRDGISFYTPGTEQ